MFFKKCYCHYIISNIYNQLVLCIAQHIIYVKKCDKYIYDNYNNIIMSTTKIYNINKLFVEIFQSLAKYDSEDTAFNNLAVVFGTTDMTDNLLLQFSASWTKNSDNIENLKYFENTNFSDIYNNKMNDTEKKAIYDKFKQAYDLSQVRLLESNIPKSNNEIFDTLLENENLQKMFNLSKSKVSEMKNQISTNPELQEIIKQFQTGLNNNDGCDSLTLLMSNLMGNNDIMTSYQSLIKKPLNKKIMKSLFSAFGEFKNDKLRNEKLFSTIYERLQREHPHIIVYFTQIGKLFDMDQLSKLLLELEKQLPELNFTNINDILEFGKSYIIKNPSIQTVLWKLQTTFQSGLINIQNLKEYGKTIAIIALQECINNNIVTKNDGGLVMNMLLSKLTNQPNNKKNQKTPQERRDRRLKNSRRQKRQQYKKQKKH
jgi:hypothetical protein